MIVCQRCGKENQDHYKFCLGCGAEIKDAGSADDSNSVGMMKTMMADVGASGQTPAPNLPGVGAPSGPPPGVSHSAPVGPPPGAPAPQHAPPAGYAPMQPPAGPPPGVAAGPGGAAPAPRSCPSCGADVPPNFKFCGVCGQSLGDAPPRPDTAGAEPSPPAAPTSPDLARATMTLIRPDGSEGGQHQLEQGINVIGREHAPIFENDGYLSPTHAELEVSGHGAVVRDLDSLNGVFVRMTGEEEIQPGQILRIGQELLRFDVIEAPQPTADGTEVMGSPNPGYWGKITVVIGEGCDGSAFPLLGDSVTLGRERGDINFPDDGYVSGLHARLSARDGKVYLTDMGSSNGTFIKVHRERSLGHESFVLLGQQLFRINLG